MLTKSFKVGKLYKVKKEKRYKKRRKFIYEVDYPVINGKSFIDEKSKIDNFLIRTTDLTEYGIGVRSNIMLSQGDFLNLNIKVDNSPIFECMCIVRWVGVDDESYIAGCEFCNIRNEDRIYIRQFMNSN